MAQRSFFLADCTAKLTALQTELQSVEILYGDLKQRRATLLHEIEVQQALISPVRCLPMDIMQEIFLHCLPQTHDAVISSNEFPLILTRICSTWRTVAINTPALWSSIHVPIPDAGGINIPQATTPLSRSNEDQLTIDTAYRRALAVTTWLGRSGGCTLSITLHKGYGYHPDPTMADNIIIDALLPFAERWGTFNSNAPTNLKRIAALPAPSFPRLHTVTFHGSPLWMPTTPAVLWATSGLVRAPLLRSVAYNDVTEDFSHFPLPFAQLTQLVLRQTQVVLRQTAVHTLFSATKLAEILSLCPRLRHCHLVFVSPSWQSSMTPLTTSVPLLSLVKLTIESPSQTQDVSRLLETLSVPVLEDLSCHGYTVKALPSFIPRIAHTLHVLALDPRFFIRGQLLQCIRECNVLSKLSIIDFPPNAVQPPMILGVTGKDMSSSVFLDDNLLHMLNWGSSEPNQDVLLPKLTEFECAIAYHSFTDEAILAFLNARAPVLRKAKIMFTRQEEFPMGPGLEKLAQKGVDCQLIYSLPPVRKHLSAWDGIL